MDHRSRHRTVRPSPAAPGLRIWHVWPCIGIRSTCPRPGSGSTAASTRFCRGVTGFASTIARPRAPMWRSFRSIPMEPSGWRIRGRPVKTTTPGRIGTTNYFSPGLPIGPWMIAPGWGTSSSSPLPRPSISLIFDTPTTTVAGTCRSSRTGSTKTLMWPWTSMSHASSPTGNSRPMASTSSPTA